MIILRVVKATEAHFGPLNHNLYNVDTVDETAATKATAISTVCLGVGVTLNSLVDVAFIAESKEFPRISELIGCKLRILRFPSY